eukprot:scaffold4827_cov109-Isochrysis_galbana.AAC.7
MGYVTDHPKSHQSESTGATFDSELCCMPVPSTRCPSTRLPNVAGSTPPLVRLPRSTHTRHADSNPPPPPTPTPPWTSRRAALPRGAAAQDVWRTCRLCRGRCPPLLNTASQTASQRRERERS